MIAAGGGSRPRKMSSLVGVSLEGRTRFEAYICDNGMSLFGMIDCYLVLGCKIRKLIFIDRPGLVGWINSLIGVFLTQICRDFGQNWLIQ